MKCPKCGYLGFEDVERCRNCGYEFALIHTPQPEALPELPLRPKGGEALPSADLDLTTDPPVGSVPQAPWQLSPDIERPITTTPAGTSQTELPLFRPSHADDTPLITKPSPPRPPLSVRRATADAPRVRPEPRRAPLFDLPNGSAEAAASAADALTERLRRDEALPSNDEPRTAGLGARLGAAFLDVTILTVVDVVVVYFTLQICGLTPDELAVLPKAPLLAFLLVQNGGYLVAFTLGGQTIGKIAAGIRVVSSEPDAPLDLGRAVLRTMVWVALALPAGLGFLTAVFSPDHRGLHDRFAGTRVVRAVS
jgi:uncharacterized RDD family membrane protein YckC